ncbi:hypothetical protein [Brevundimonas naejangsanensis]|uniref:hypothetical protein n=1 Tax=Brevundimonas naejangsanensis TaxID=588932 RepID=UPI003D027D7D
MRLIDRLHAKSGPIRAFVTSVMIGALVAAAPVLPLVVTVAILSFSEVFEAPGHIIQSLIQMAAPFFIAFPFVLLPSFIFGIPTFFILRKMDNETVETYMIAGAVLGLALPIFLLLVVGAETGHLFLSLTGAASGSATAWSWARYRLSSKGRSPV